MNWQNVTVKLSDLQPWEHNPRTMTKKQAQRLLKSWKDLGQFQTIAIGPRENGSGHPVYDGHQRLSALLAAYGAQYAIDARQSDRALTEDERRYLITQANLPVGAWRFEEIAGWPEAQEWGFDAEMLATWNADGAALATMLEAEQPQGDADAEPQIDRAEELNRKWKVKAGDLWRIGEHRLLCGDSTKREDVERVMGGDIAELLFTSPPYADMREYDGHELDIDYLSGFILAWGACSNYQVINLGLKRSESEIIEYWGKYILVAKSIGLKLLSWNIWNRAGMGGTVSQMTAMFPIEHEFIFVFGKKEKDINRTRENKSRNTKSNSTIRQRSGETVEHLYVAHDFGKLGTVFFCDVERGIKDHPAMFPVELPSEYIRAMTNVGEIVADSFIGSGTTLVACQNLQRKCRAIEISPNYCAVILERMATAFPGIEIERISEAVLTHGT